MTILKFMLFVAVAFLTVSPSRMIGQEEKSTAQNAKGDPTASSDCTDKKWEISKTQISPMGNGTFSFGGMPPYLWLSLRFKDRSIVAARDFNASLRKFRVKNAKGAQEGTLDSLSDKPKDADAVLVFKRGSSPGEGWESTAGLTLEGFDQTCKLKEMSVSVKVTSGSSDEQKKKE